MGLFRQMGRGMNRSIKIGKITVCVEKEQPRVVIQAQGSWG
jgi:hypothetical protein